MKVGIVKANSLKKHGRWDAAFYLGKQATRSECAIPELEQRLQEAEAELEETKADAKCERVAEEARVRQLVESGDVERISNTGDNNGDTDD